VRPESSARSESISFSDGSSFDMAFWLAWYGENEKPWIIAGQATSTCGLLIQAHTATVAMPSTAAARKPASNRETRVMGRAGEGREFRLREALAPVREQYDHIFIDCPPSLNMLTVNALVAADSVLIPMQCEYYALEGLSALVSTVDQLAGTNPGLHIEGILRTMFDPR